MTIEEAIEKAVEGGYTLPHRWKNISYEDKRIYISGNGADNRSVNISSVLLDPLFWQSLGKAMGWAEFDIKKASVYGTWYMEWHRFIDHLAEGKSIESFFASLKDTNIAL